MIGITGSRRVGCREVEIDKCREKTIVVGVVVGVESRSRSKTRSRTQWLEVEVQVRSPWPLRDAPAKNGATEKRRVPLLKKLQELCLQLYNQRQRTKERVQSSPGERKVVWSTKVLVFEMSSQWLAFLPRLDGVSAGGSTIAQLSCASARTGHVPLALTLATGHVRHGKPTR